MLNNTILSFRAIKEIQDRTIATPEMVPISGLLRMNPNGNNKMYVKNEILFNV